MWDWPRLGPNCPERSIDTGANVLCPMLLGRISIGPLTITDVLLMEANLAETAGTQAYRTTLGLMAVRRPDLIVDAKNDLAYGRRPCPRPAQPPRRSVLAARPREVERTYPRRGERQAGMGSRHLRLRPVAAGRRCGRHEIDGAFDSQARAILRTPGWDEAGANPNVVATGKFASRSRCDLWVYDWSGPSCSTEAPAACRARQGQTCDSFAIGGWLPHGADAIWPGFGRETSPNAGQKQIPRRGLSDRSCWGSLGDVAASTTLITQRSSVL